VEEENLGGNVLLHAMFGRKSDVLASQNSMEQAL
jgi:hypothetical protein